MKKNISILGSTGSIGLDAFKILSRKKNMPYALIAKTIKGNPVSFMKNVPMWHYRSPNKLEFKKALDEIKKYEKRI